MTTRATGIVRTFDAQTGLGWITADGRGGDFPFQHAAVQGTTYGMMARGHRIAFDASTGANGCTARNIVRLG